MHLSITDVDVPQEDFIALSRKAAARETAPAADLAITGKLSALGLVIASAGFGMLYAWTVGSHGGMVVLGVPLLAVLSALMALSLECAKPVAVAGCLVAFRERKIAQGVLLTALGLVAVVYSLSAELSLMAMLRSDSAAQRQSVIDAKASQVATERRRVERYEAAKAEIASMTPSRPVAEVQAEIDGLLIAPNVNGCRAINGSATRKICPKVATARIELARAKRRAELEALLTATAAAPSSGMQTHSVAVADPGAAALSTYLAMLGFSIRPEHLADWLVLLAVLALEIGSALAGVLAGSVRPSPKKDAPIKLAPTPQRHAVTIADDQPPAVAMTGAATATAAGPEIAAKASEAAGREEGAKLPVATHPAIPLAPVPASGRDEAAQRIMSLLHDSGGILEASRNAIGKMIAATPSTAYAAMTWLASQGAIAVHSNARGSTIRLAASAPH